MFAAGRKREATQRASSGIRNIDPYVVWADLTHRRGLNSESRSQQDVPVLLEFTGNYREVAHLIDPKAVLVAPIYTAAETRFCTALLQWTKVIEISNAIIQSQARPIQRLELGSAIGSPSPYVGLASFDKKKDGPARLAGPVIAFIDYGCPFAHEHFRAVSPEPSTRVRYFWDQGRQLANRMVKLLSRACGIYREP